MAANYPYDPYAGEAGQEPVTIGSIAKQAANPLNWLIWNYQYNPGAWSISKGLQVPIGSNIWGKNAKNSFSKTFFGNKTTPSEFSNFYKAARKTGGPVTSSIEAFTKSLGGEWRLGQKMMENTSHMGSFAEKLNKTLQTSVSNRISSVNLTAAQNRRISSVLSQEIFGMLDNSNGVAGISPATLGKNIRARGTAEFLQKIGITSEQWKSVVERVRPGLIPELRNMVGKEQMGEYKNLAFKQAGSKAFKGLMMAGKAFAAFGVVSLMWDISKMIGEPLGRYAVENGNRVLNALQNRFMPEMGGKIAMSYMSSGAATERQRAVEAISRSYINGRSAIGQEAMYFHG